MGGGGSYNDQLRKGGLGLAVSYQKLMLKTLTPSEEIIIHG